MYLTEVSSHTKLKTGVLHLFGLVNRFLVGKANWKVLHLAQNIKSGVLIKQTVIHPNAQSCPQSLLRAWAQGLGGSGDKGFEVLDFTTSGHFWFSTTFLIAFICSCRSVNDCKFRWFKAFKRESSNLLLNRKWPEALKSRTSNPVSPETPGLRAQAPRRLWGRECQMLRKYKFNQ